MLLVWAPPGFPIHSIVFAVCGVVRTMRLHVEIILFLIVDMVPSVTPLPTVLFVHVRFGVYDGACGLDY